MGVATNNLTKTELLQMVKRAGHDQGFETAPGVEQHLDGTLGELGQPRGHEPGKGR
ncbi:MAG: hypothetical protein SFT92_02125 [Rickettsiales bacterium]|nr:hypothetical protein [Rickettsiales bacterium]